MPDTGPKWERLVWRAFQHADLTLRQWRQSLRIDLNPKKVVRMTEEQARCPHPRREHRRGGNRYGSYTHCMKCGLRLSFLSAEERDRQKMKPASSTSTSTPPTSTRANPKAAPTSPSKPSTAAVNASTPSPASSTVPEDLLSAVLTNQQKQTEIISNSLAQVVRQQQELTGALMQSMSQLQQQMAWSAASSSAHPAQPQVKEPQQDPPASAQMVDLSMNDTDSDLEFVP